MSFALFIPTNPVTLNSFQGPSGRILGASWMGTKLACVFAILRSGCGDKWTLKRVQGDEERGGLK